MTRIRNRYWGCRILRGSLLLACIAASFTCRVEPRAIDFRHIVIDVDPPLRPHCKTIGDIDGDGSVDVIAASSAAQGLWWYAHPHWSKHRIDSGSFTTDMQVSDVDGDGDLDVIVPRSGSGLSWYENPRPGGDPKVAPWLRHLISEEGAHDVEVGDLDGDTRLDVVVRSGATRVFLQENPDSWKRIEIATGGRGGTALGDLDGDGDLDLAQNGYWLEFESASGSFARHEIAGGWPDDSGVQIADVDGDGRQDVLLAPAEQPGRLIWYEAPPTAAAASPWVEHVIDRHVSHVHTFKTGDVDNDGDLDVICAEMEQSRERRIMVYLNEGAATSWKRLIVGRSGSHNLRVADVGNDGDLDIVGANHGNHGGATPLEYWENVSVDERRRLRLDRWRRRVVDAKKPWRSVFVAARDLDGDARPDIVTGGWWYQNPGNTGEPWVRRDLGAPLRNMAAVYDFDRDGDFDVLGTQGRGSTANASFVWARNEGGGSFRVLHNIEEAQGDFLQGAAVACFFGFRQLGVALSWHRPDQGIQMLRVPGNPSREPWSWHRISNVSQDEQLSFGHIDRDVHVDLLLGTRWLRNGRNSPDWSDYVIADVAGAPDRNRLVDLDGDGRLDALVGFEATNAKGKLAWYGQPDRLTERWAEHVIADVMGPMSLDAADMDRDGDVDVIVGEHNYAAPETARLIVFENVDGAGIEWRPHVVYTGDEHHDGALVVDIDLDGDLDIVSIGWSHANVMLYENRAIE